MKGTAAVADEDCESRGTQETMEFSPLHENIIL